MAVGTNSEDQTIGQEASGQLQQERGWAQEFSELLDASCVESFD